MAARKTREVVIILEPGQVGEGGAETSRGHQEVGQRSMSVVCAHDDTTRGQPTAEAEWRNRRAEKVSKRQEGGVRRIMSAV